MRSTDDLRLAGEAYKSEPVPENLGTVVDLSILEGTRAARGRRFGALKKICAASSRNTSARAFCSLPPQSVRINPILSASMAIPSLISPI